MLAHPAERALAVDQVVRPLRSRAEAVVRGHAHPTLECHGVHEGPALRALVANHPCAAVDLEEHRRTLRPGERAIHVEEMTVARAFGVAKVADALDACVSDPERQ